MPLCPVQFPATKILSIPLWYVSPWQDVSKWHALALWKQQDSPMVAMCSSYVPSAIAVGMVLVWKSTAVWLWYSGTRLKLKYVLGNVGTRRVPLFFCTHYCALFDIMMLGIWPSFKKALQCDHDILETVWNWNVCWGPLEKENRRCPFAFIITHSSRSSSMSHLSEIACKCLPWYFLKCLELKCVSCIIHYSYSLLLFCMNVNVIPVATVYGALFWNAMSAFGMIFGNNYFFWTHPLHMPTDLEGMTYPPWMKYAKCMKRESSYARRCNEKNMCTLHSIVYAHSLRLVHMCGVLLIQMQTSKHRSPSTTK